MTSDSTTQARWPLLNERASYAAPTAIPSRRRLPRSAWLLTALAFLCGGLVSAAAFSIGWRHQAQRDTAARAALAASTAHANRLSASLASTRETLASERQAQAQAAAALRATSRAAAALAAQAASAGKTADTLSSDAGDIAAAASRVSRELQTLLTYLTTTPASQIDPGYIASQATYLTRQLTALQDSGAGIGTAGTSFKTAVRKLARDAAKLPRH
jgi:septal ring factor EnvC (AmiA/AmiB activator)